MVGVGVVVGGVVGGERVGVVDWIGDGEVVEVGCCVGCGVVGAGCCVGGESG